MTTIDLQAFREQEQQRNITCRKHPTADLLIWNYTAKTQYEKNWNSVTRMARGLITDTTGTIIARPFEKFFNYEEVLDRIPKEKFTVTEKLDGSLGILYFIDGEPFIATRGSFESEQAIRATRIVQEKYGSHHFNPYYTYLFEIIYPQNRIVINYKDIEDLYLLAMIHTETGVELDIQRFQFPFPIVKQYNITDLQQLRAIQETDKEGFVVRFEYGFRCKMKFDEYVHLHRILTNCTARTIWEYLKDGRSLNTLLEKVPDEFYVWVKNIAKELSQKYTMLHHRTHEVYKEIKDAAKIDVDISTSILTLQDLQQLQRQMNRHMHEEFSKYPEIMSFLFILYSNQPSKAKMLLQEAIWKTLKPAHELPFKEEV